MHLKKIIGTKCCLSPIDINDSEKYAEWYNDQDVTMALNIFTKNISLETAKEIIKDISKDHNYAIIAKISNEIIGFCGFKNIDYLNQTAGVGITLGNKNFWNKGYGTEALSLLLNYGFTALNIHNIFLTVLSNNNRAIKCYEKIGFKKIGSRRESLMRNRQKNDEIYMDILCEEFYCKNK